MNKHWRWIVVAFLVIAAAGTVLIKNAVDTSKAEKEVQDQASTDTETEPIDGLPTLIDLGAGTCIPCKMMAPILDELQRDYHGKVNVIVIDVYEKREEAAKYNIYAIPTQIFFDASGKELYRHEGFMAKEEVISKFVELGMVK